LFDYAEIWYAGAVWVTELLNLYTGALGPYIGLVIKAQTGTRSDPLKLQCIAIVTILCCHVLLPYILAKHLIMLGRALSVDICLSVENAWIVTKRNNRLQYINTIRSSDVSGVFVPNLVILGLGVHPERVCTLCRNVESETLTNNL